MRSGMASNVTPINPRVAMEVQCDIRDPENATYCWLHMGHSMFHENIQGEQWCETHTSWNCRCIEYGIAP